MNTLLQPIVLQADPIQNMIQNISNNVLGTAQGVVGVIAAAALACLGIWYIVAGQEDLPRIKKWFIRVIVGLLIALTATSIIQYFQGQASSWS